MAILTKRRGSLQQEVQLSLHVPQRRTLLGRVQAVRTPGATADSRLNKFDRRVSELTDAPVEFALIPHDDWYQPSWIDEDRATKAREDMVKNQVIYGGKLLFVTRFPHDIYPKQGAYPTAICVASTLE